MLVVVIHTQTTLIRRITNITVGPDIFPPISQFPGLTKENDEKGKDNSFEIRKNKQTSQESFTPAKIGRARALEY